MAKFDKYEPGELNETEGAILEYLFAHPEWEISTFGLMKILRPVAEGTDSEKQQEHEQQSFKEIEHGVETLILAKYVKGKRLGTNWGAIYYDELKLTTAGEQEAIRQKRRVKVDLDVGDLPEGNA